MSALPDQFASGPAGALLERAALLEWQTLPDEVRDTVILSLLDTVGVGIAGAASPLAHAFLTAEAKALGGGDGTILGRESSGPPALAAAANAFSAEVWEWSHGHYGSAGHVSAAVIPAVLALGESLDCDGLDALSAIVAGFEVAGRVGRLLQPQVLSRGFLSIGMGGAMGAAFAGGRLLRLKRPQLQDAVGIAGFLCARSPVESYTSNIKGAEVARAAEVGIRAALLAEAGMEGSALAIENLVTEFAGKQRAQELADLPPSGFETLNIYFKQYPSCRFTHAALEGLLSLQRQSPFELDDVTEVRFTVSRPAATLCLARADAGSAMWDRQFSLPFLAALTLSEGIDWATNPALIDAAVSPEVLALQERVHVQIDEDLRVIGHAHGAVSEIKLGTSSVLQAKVPAPLGSPGRPMAVTDWERKFANFIDYPDLSAFAHDFAKRPVRESLEILSAQVTAARARDGGPRTDSRGAP